jgi:hypothetical protein
MILAEELIMAATWHRVSRLSCLPVGLLAAGGPGRADEEPGLLHLGEWHDEPATAVELDVRVRSASCEGFFPCHWLSFLQRPRNSLVIQLTIDLHG